MARPRIDHRLAPPEPPSGGGLLSGVLALARWAVLPLGLIALVAVGVHAAADTLDDRLLLVVERADAWLDGVLGAWSATQSWVELIGPEQRLRIARGLTLAWELVVDVVLAWPVIAYRVRSASEARAVRTKLRGRPSPMLVLRPAATAVVCLAGACAVAQMAQGALYLSVLDAMGPSAEPAARGLAVAVLLGVLASLGWRAVVGSFQDACDVVAESGSRAAALAGGLWGSALAVPLAVAALLDASPVLSFFR